MQIECIVILSMLMAVVIAQDADYMVPVNVLEQGEQSINYLKVSTDLQELIFSDSNNQLYANSFINKSIVIQTQQLFTYQSSLLSPIYLLDHENCHSHEGTIQVEKVEDVVSHNVIVRINNNRQEEKQYNQLSDDKKQQQEQKPSQSIMTNSWVYNKKYQLLYKITPDDLKVTAYKVDRQSLLNKASIYSQSIEQVTHSSDSQQNPQLASNSITPIATISLFHLDNKKQSSQCLQEFQSNVLTLLSKTSQHLYVFACDAVFMIECRSVLAKASLLMVFDDEQIKEERKVFYGIEVKSVNGYVFWVSENQGVRIYGVGIDGRLEYVNTIVIDSQQIREINKLLQKNDPKGYQLSSIVRLSSVQYFNGLLYILTENDGIIIFQRQLTFRFRLIWYIDYLSELKDKMNQQIIVSDGRMLVWTRVKRWQFVSEIRIAKHSKNNDGNSQEQSVSSQPSHTTGGYYTYTLNRYFKGYRSINKISVITEQSLFTNINQNNPQRSLDDFLMITSEKGLQVFPLDRDVRQISLMMNGVVNNHFGDGLVQMVDVSGGLWVVEAMGQQWGGTYDEGLAETKGVSNTQEIIQTYQRVDTQVSIMALRVVYPSIECSFRQQGRYTILVEQAQPNDLNTTSNAYIPQQSYVINSTIASTSHYQPHYYHRLFITVIPSSSSSNTHFSLFILSIGIFTLLLIVGLLIYWRQKKLNLIDNIVSQIRLLNAAKRKVYQLQLHEENSIDKKWNELKEEVMEEVSYKINGDYDTQQGEEHVMSSERRFVKDIELEQKNFKLFTKIQPIVKQQQQPIKQQLNEPIAKKQPQRNAESNKQEIKPIIEQLSQKQIGRTLQSDLQIDDKSFLYRQLNQQRLSPQLQRSICLNEDYEHLEFAGVLQDEDEKQVNLSVLDDDQVLDDEEEI